MRWPWRKPNPATTAVMLSRGVLYFDDPAAAERWLEMFPETVATTDVIVRRQT